MKNKLNLSPSQLELYLKAKEQLRKAKSLGVTRVLLNVRHFKKGM